MTPAELLPAAVNAVLTAIAIVLLVPSSILFVECIAALFPTRSSARPGATRPRVNVLVPAHNEEAGIEATIHTLMPQLTAADQLIVVADNCDDDTAGVARAAGATVIERQDLEHRGKGYALDFGVKSMASAPPDVVVIVDADCIVAPGSIEKLAQVAAMRHRPVQAIYLLESPPRLSAKSAVSTLALWVKNWVRLTGLYNLGMPCLLTGTGMAFPWEVIRQAPLASGNIVEDMNLGMDLAIAGYSPMFCPEARVTSVLPQKEQAAKSQRTRWEHGHLQTIATQVPRLFKAALQQARLDLLVLTLDLLVPPLSLLVMLWVVALGAAGISAGLGASLIPVVLLGIVGFQIAIAILLAWAKYCRKILPAHVLLTIPLYILWKIPLYFAFLFKRQKAWVRTERDAVADSTKAEN
ncbi:MAG: glycosyltransferase family 2 protein [Leptolyngbyaceae cyanobacterium bins.349]|nr:glycosyltransferase family 2 protein [Leptolyngbyaceae cyanobacterium bins.349]